MRPPGYRRPALAFDSLDHLVVAAGVDLALWRGVRVVSCIPGETVAPAARDCAQNQLDKRVMDLADRTI